MLRIFKLLLVIFTLLQTSCFTNNINQSKQQADSPISGNGDIGDQKKLKIAILLPLSGKNSNIGNQILNSAYMALHNYKNENIKFYPFDTNDSLILSNKFVPKIKKFQLILGPLFSDNVMHVYKLAKTYNIPVFTFSNESVFLNNKGLFLLGMMPKYHILPAIYTSVINGYDNIITLLPDNKYGKTLHDIMKKNENIYDYKLIKTYYYKPLNDRVLKGLNVAVKNIYKQIVANSNKNEEEDYISHPKITIVIPEGGHKLQAIMKQFILTNKDDLKLHFTGSTQWDYDKIKSMLSLYPQYTAVVPNFNNENYINFARQYKDNFNQESSKISSMAYDFISLILALNINKGDVKKVLDIKYLRSLGTFEGILGKFQFNKKHSIDREIIIKWVNH